MTQAMAKMHNTRKARAIAADARDMLGGNGILLDYQVMRHIGMWPPARSASIWPYPAGLGPSKGVA